MTRFLRSRLLSYVLPGLVLVGAGAVSYELWERERQEIEAGLQAEFDTRVRETVSLFRERMLAYEQALHATHGLFATSAVVQRGDFQAFVARLRIDSHPGLQGLGYSQYVPATERERHVRAVRSQGFPAYALRPAGGVDEVTSAVFFEPSGSSLLGTLGSDYFAEPSRRHAMVAARDSGRVAISNKVKLPHEDAQQVQAGYRMWLPVYHPGRPTGNVQERRAAIAGWVYAAFSMDGLTGNILGERADIDIEVQDAGVGQGGEQAVDTIGDRVGGESTVKLFFASQRVEVDGYSWMLTARSLPNFATPVALSKLQLVARTGAVASLALALLTWYLLRRRIRLLRADEDLRAAKDHAEAASAAKTRFLAAASHDLRQPIQALGLFTATLESMARRPELPGPEVAHIAARLQQAVQGLGRLLDGLFELSALQNGVVTVSRRATPLAEVLAEVSTAFAGPAREKGLELRVRLPSALWVDTDPVVLRRVLSNLVANALRYTPKGRVLVGCRRRAGAVEIQVLDTGIGIAPDETAKVFGEFYQPSNVARGEEHGMGLGLAIVQRLATLLGAVVQVRSVPGRGSVFSVRLPRMALAIAAGER
ncbi:hypothetical protein FN976_05775 [Caenimonas sedimenti]|uniref:histidine kinase n=1 Tax=Caenimonas sedimenti TaxID=2596921 RepID=A0A562ZV74_9BURK|nr:CHASE domain-containing protein [Caenimonas sedimenti]TWO72215.1 hypothetical protein FN976_05775 [Caenimonas sedimenti]